MEDLIQLVNEEREGRWASENERKSEAEGKREESSYNVEVVNRGLVCLMKEQSGVGVGRKRGNSFALIHGYFNTLVVLVSLSFHANILGPTGPWLGGTSHKRSTAHHLGASILPQPGYCQWSSPPLLFSSPHLLSSPPLSSCLCLCPLLTLYSPLISISQPFYLPLLKHQLVLSAGALVRGSNCWSNPLGPCRRVMAPESQPKTVRIKGVCWVAYC